MDTWDLRLDSVSMTGETETRYKNTHFFWRLLWPFCSCLSVGHLGFRLFLGLPGNQRSDPEAFFSQRVPFCESSRDYDQNSTYQVGTGAIEDWMMVWSDLVV